jgi:hypothetical protein
MTGAAALSLASCDGSDISVAQIVAMIQTSCGFVTTAQAIIPVIITVLNSFNASAGAAATVTNQIAQQVADMVCKAVQSAAASSPKAAPGSVPPQLRIVVNGVAVPGHLMAPKAG